MIRYALRSVAVAIAVAGVWDPVWTLERPAARSLMIAVLQQGSPVRHATGISAWPRALQLRELLERDFRVSLQPHDSRSRAATCPAAGGCLLVSDGPLPARLSDGATVIGALRAVPSGPSAVITGIDSRRGAHVDAASVLDVEIEIQNPVADSVNVENPSAAASRAIKLRVFDGHALVGAADHRWPADAAKAPVSATVPVEWVPLAAGARRLRVVASVLEGDQIISSHEAETAVDVRSEPARVLLHEPEASWMGTFVRRTLEADRRFRVDARIQIAPGISVSRGGDAGLRREQLDDAAVVVVTAPERLTVSDVDLLERYSRVRGGSVVLLLAGQPSGPVGRLIPSVARMQHEPEPQAAGLLRARDLLTFTPSPVVTPLASIGGRPVVVARAIGRGRIIVSGAVDSWRYREGGGFARFWSSLVADAAGATGLPVEVRVWPTLLKPGEEALLRVEWRTTDPRGPQVSAEAFVDCGGERRSVRLWPEARIGSFSGTFAAGQPGTCAVTASLNGSRDRTQAAILVATDVRRPVPGARTFADAIAAQGGTVEDIGGEAKLAARARELLPPATEPQRVRPMHSPWWIVPFAGCLCAEWALRRRAGFR